MQVLSITNLENDGQQEDCKKHYRWEHGQKVVGVDDTGTKHPVAEFSQEDEGHDEGDAGVGDEDVGWVTHDCHGWASVTLSDQAEETLRDILWSHQASKLLQVWSF